MQIQALFGGKGAATAAKAAKATKKAAVAKPSGKATRFQSLLLFQCFAPGGTA
jgi:hypothetical protein